MIVVPASMREDPTGNDQPLDRAWTIRTNGMRVPASMREEVNGIVQPLDSAGSTIKSDAIEVVSAPRLGPKFASIEIAYEILCWNL